MPQVKANLGPTLADIGLGNVPMKLVDPHLAVAKGAALYAYKCAIDGQVKHKIAEATGQLETEVQIQSVDPGVRAAAERHVASELGIRLSDVQHITTQEIQNTTGKTFGVKTATDDEGREFQISNLIQAGAKLPQDGTKTFGTLDEGQTTVLVECMEGNSDEPMCPLADGEPIGDPIRVEFGRPLPRRSPVDIRFKLSANGRLSVTATERSTGAMGTGEFRTGAIKSAAELEKRKAVTGSITIS